MNPFFFDGPHFLWSFIVGGGVLLGGLRWWMNREPVERMLVTAEMTSDPYRIACLRGGPNEAVKTATIALIDRGLLNVSRDVLHTRDQDAVEIVKRPIEKEILRNYLNPKKIERTPNFPLAAICSMYENELRSHGLLVTDSEKSEQTRGALLVVGILAATAMIKIMIAYANGHHNINFLIILTVVFSLVAFFMSKKRTTPRGAALLADLRILFERLKSRANTVRSGGETNELALLIAVFGMQSLSLSNFPYIRTLYPKNTGSDSGGDGCGSDGGGGDGGGGGCGGGCGGCGG